MLCFPEDDDFCQIYTVVGDSPSPPPFEGSIPLWSQNIASLNQNMAPSALSVSRPYANPSPLRTTPQPYSAPVRTDPYSTTPVKTEPYSTTPVRTDPYTTTPVKTEPYGTTPVRTNSYTTTPVRTEPYSTTPVRTGMVGQFPSATVTQNVAGGAAHAKVGTPSWTTKHVDYSNYFPKNPPITSPASKVAAAGSERTSSSGKGLSSEEIRRNMEEAAWIMKMSQDASIRKPFQCDKCKKRFTVEASLNRHLKVSHGGVKAFECIVCGKTFGYKQNLLTHMKRHSGGKNFACEICGKCFIQKHELVTHIRQAH